MDAFDLTDKWTNVKADVWTNQLTDRQKDIETNGQTEKSERQNEDR